MNFLIENWYMVVAFIALGAFLGFNANRFLKLPKATQKKIILSVLISLVKLAEKEFGGGAGTRKLAFVYDVIVSVPLFAWVKDQYTLEQFDQLVQVALKKSGIWLEDK